MARTSAGWTDMMAEPPSPWKVRAAISQGSEGASAQPIEASENSASPKRYTWR